MKRLVLFFLFFPAHVQAQLCFDFESGTLEHWIQSRDSAWGISDRDALSGNLSLWHRLDDSVSSEDRISFPYDSLVIDGETTSWQFALRHAYLPSSSNKWAVFLISDRDEQQMKPGGEAGAIVLSVNFSGSDDILKLWKTEKGHAEILVETDLNWQEEIGTGPALIRVEREPGGRWLIYRGAGLAMPFDVGKSVSVIPGPERKSNGNDLACREAVYEPPVWELIGEGQDTGRISPDHFGIYYRFSSRQDRKLWFDDLCISGIFLRDTLPPSIIAVEVLNAFTLRIFFSESIDQNAQSGDRYIILPAGILPDTILPVSESTVDVVFGQPFPSGIQQTLQAKRITDRKGNASGTLEKDFTFFRPGSGDIIFNEIMYDPVPEIDLPGYEYIELYNRTGHPVKLDGWTLQAGSRKMVLPDFKLPPGGYLLLCYKGMKEQYPGANHTFDVLTSRTMLLNEGALLQVRDPDSVLIDWMEYSPALHTGEYFAEGGWSLERIDPDRPCHGADNWTTTTGKLGGTPGMENAARGNNPDRSPPSAGSVYLPDSQKLVIGFNEPMERESVLQEDAWHVDGGMGAPDSVILLEPRNRELILQFGEEFTPGREYYLEISREIKDCAGNPMSPGQRIRFALPVQPQRSEILISEVLFNPLPYCPDFVEVFNPGLKTFDLADLRLANRDAQSGEIVSVVRIINGHRLFFPGEYLVFTPDPETLRGFYLVHDPRSLVKVQDMPPMGDIQGSVLVLDKYLNVLDEFAYNRDMHHPMLASPEGVTLERISYTAGSEHWSNWHSASSTEGYGTPGRLNSQHLDPDPARDEGFEVEPEIFTPDMDGVNDVLLIKYRFRTPGMRGRILVLDPRGRLIREIAVKQLLGTEGFFTWDGTDGQGRKARTGIYLVLAEVYGMNGGVRRYRKTCVLSTGR